MQKFHYILNNERVLAVKCEQMVRFPITKVFQLFFFVEKQKKFTQCKLSTAESVFNIFFRLDYNLKIVFEIMIHS